MIDKRIKQDPFKKQQLIDIVTDSFATIEKSNRTTLERKWNDLYQLYRGFMRKGSYSGRADLDWASAYIAVEIIAPRLYRTLFPRSQWFGLTGVEGADEKQAKIIQEFLKNRFDNPIKVRQKMIPYLRYLCIFGTLICKTPFRHETRNVPTRVRKVGEDGIERPTDTEKELVIWDDIDLQLVDLFDFYVADDTINNIDDQPFVIHRTRENMQSLKKNVYDEEDNPTGAYENIDELEENLIATGKNSNPSEEPMNHHLSNRYRELGISPRTYDHMGKNVILKEFQGEIDMFGETDLWIITVANDNTLVQAEILNTPDRKKTYVSGKYIEQANEFWGMSAIERSERVSYELNDRANQTMDITGQIINPIYLNTDADIQEGKLKIFPSRVIRTMSKDGLSALRPPTEVLTPAYAAIKELVSLGQDITGATRFLGGSAQTPELQRTATGIVSIIKEANSRIDLVVQGFEDSFIKEFLRKAYKYTQFYSTRKQVVKLVGKHAIEYQEFNPQDILGDYDFIPMGSQSLGSEEIIAQQSINFLNVVARIPGLPERIDMDLLVTKIAQNMLGFHDAQELLLMNKRQDEEIEKIVSENTAFLQGLPAQVSPAENHRLHAELHGGILMDPRLNETQNAEVVRQLIQEHIAQHEQYALLQGAPAVMNAVNGQQPQGGGAPPQSQPNPSAPEDIINQLAQPSQLGTQ